MENTSNNNNNNGVRKGAWTKQEDLLLRDCIHTYGEGKWHLVPLRAGLNRCRKSCRLRWLNYLRPNLNRGFFTKDEVDLIVRLHKLLGNRWSLIAGRLPGRTANDVKNFWNSHISKRPPPAGESSRRKTITESKIVRPRPRTFSNSQPPAWSTELTRSNSSSSSSSSSKKPPTNDDQTRPSSSPPLSVIDRTNNDENPNIESRTLQEDLDECMRWWGDLLDMTENGEQNPFLLSEDVSGVTESAFPRGIGDQDGLCGDLSFDGDMVWNLD